MEYTIVKSKIETEFTKKTPPEEAVCLAMDAKLNSMDVLGTLAHVDSLYSRAGFHNKVCFGLLRNAMADIPDMARFDMYRAPSDYGALKNAVEEYEVGRKVFFADCQAHRVVTDWKKKILPKPDARLGAVQQLDSKVEQFAGQIQELSIVVRKNLKAPGASADNDWTRSY
eukprot:gb/GEZJ01001733.1/.p1 GENE.gb/GEZJ01001733.1/~~gb/GEZJ01001733.1/.p1  ORF type:complete len:170 (-),score=22.78 gb/GEZJ01001733.1/:5290-5799(-)